jgi:hypothetical protein
LLIYGVTQDSRELVNLDMQSQVEQQAAAAGTERALSAVAQTARAAARIQRNLNRRMVLERFLFGAVRQR